MRLGEPLLDAYLEFVAARCRPNTVLAVAFDLKVFFTVVGKPPAEVTPARRARVRHGSAGRRGHCDRLSRWSMAGGGGVSARTVRRRLSTVSGLFAFLQARGDVAANPVPRGLPTRRERSRPRQGVPLVRSARTLPKILSPDEVDALTGALRTHRDRAMVAAMVLGGLRRCEVLGLRLADLRFGERRVFVAEGKGGHQRLIPISGRFFGTVADYLDDERPADAGTDRVFVVLKGPRRGQPLSASGLDEVVAGARRRAGLERGDVPPAAAHLPDPAARGGDGAGGGPGPGRARLDRVDPHLPAPRPTTGWPGSTGAPPRRSTRRPVPEHPGGGGGQRREPAVSAPRAAGDLAADRSGRPSMAATMRRYLRAARLLAAPGQRRARRPGAAAVRRLPVDQPHRRRGVAAISRGHIEDYKVWLAARPGRDGPRVSDEHPRQRLGMLRMFFERIIDWDWPDAPTRIPILLGDLPRRTSRCPRPSTTRPPPSSCAPPQNQPRLLVRRRRAKCSPAPACASASSATCTPTRSCRSATGTGCASRSASCTTTATSRCTRTWSTLLADYRQPARRPRPTRCCCRGSTASRSTATASPAT